MSDQQLSPKVSVAIGIALVTAGLVGIGWYFLRSNQRPTTIPSQIVTPPAAIPATPEAPAERAPVAKPHRSSPRRRAVVPPKPAADSKSSQITSLQMLAREAYIKKNYAEPSDSSAIVYTKRALALDATDNYSKKLLEDSVQGGKYQVQQAIAHKDFAGATRLANALAKLLPGRRDIAGLKEDIAAAQTAAARLRPRSRPTP